MELVPSSSECSPAAAGLKSPEKHNSVFVLKKKNKTVEEKKEVVKLISYILVVGDLSNLVPFKLREMDLPQNFKFE